jgi:hypothetical protein
MAIQVSGTEVISNARALANIASVDATSAASISAAGVGGGSITLITSPAVTPSTTSITISGLTLTSYKFLQIEAYAVRVSATAYWKIDGSRSLNAADWAGNRYNYQTTLLDLTTGFCSTDRGGAWNSDPYPDDGTIVNYISAQPVVTTYTTATTSISMSLSTGTFTSGNFYLYGIA